MILLWVSYFCLINGLTAQEVKPTSGSVDNTIIDVKSPYSKTVMCSYRRNMNYENPLIPNLEPQDLPTECAALLYDRVSVSPIAQINVDYESLKLATSVRPVIVSIFRDSGYRDWARVLTPEGNKAEADALCKFAKENDIKGFMLTQLAPTKDEDTLNVNISQYILPYLKQIKCSEEFIIGVSVNAISSFIKCPCVYDFAQMNELVDFYRIYTYSLNACRPEIYNGEVGLKSMKHGDNYIVGMMEVAEFLKESKANFDKFYYAVQLGPTDAKMEFKYNSYVEVCEGSLNITRSCVPNTNDYFEKGKFVKSQNAGLDVAYVELDDIKNSCSCGKFIGFNNIMAGYNKKSAIPCPKFDVQIAST